MGSVRFDVPPVNPPRTLFSTACLSPSSLLSDSPPVASGVTGVRARDTFLGVEVLTVSVAGGGNSGAGGSILPVGASEGIGDWVYAPIGMGVLVSSVARGISFLPLSGVLGLAARTSGSGSGLSMDRVCAGIARVGAFLAPVPALARFEPALLMLFNISLFGQSGLFAYLTRSTTC